eukprot:RCo038118
MKLLSGSLIFFLLSSVGSTDVLIGTLHDSVVESFAADIQGGLRLAFAEFNSMPSSQRCDRTLRLVVGNSSASGLAAQTSLESLLSLGVAALVGVTGTVAVDLSVSLAGASGIPSIAPTSGNAGYRVPASENVVFLRVSQSDEVLALVNVLRVQLGLQLAALFYEPDFTGEASVQTSIDAFNATGLGLLSLVAFNASGANFLAMGGYVDLMLAQSSPFVPEAVVVISTDRVASAFIQECQSRPVLVGTRFGVTSLQNFSVLFDGIPARSNVLASSVVPFSSGLGANTTGWAALARFETLWASALPGEAPTAAAFEGYLTGRLASAIVQRIGCSSAVSPATVAAALYGCCCTVTIEDLTVGPFLNQSCGQGLRQVWVLQPSSNNSELIPAPQPLFGFLSGACNAGISQLGPKALVYGQSVALSGSNGGAGAELQSGVKAAFAHQNALGGLSGHPLSLISLDDSYSIARAVANTQALSRLGVLGLMGYYGTGIANAVMEVARAVRLPFIAPFTGTATLRGADVNTINVRASYVDEINALVKFVAHTLGLSRISLFYQDDSFGQQGLNAFTSAMLAINLPVLSKGTYPPNTVNVEAGLSKLLADAFPLVPEAILVWTNGPAGAAFIPLARLRLPTDTVYLCCSVVGTDFASKFIADYQNLYVSQVLPLATDTSYAIVKDYISVMDEYNSSLSHSTVSFEGYVNVRLAVEVLKDVPESALMNPASFSQALIKASSVVVSQLVIGPYSTSCNQGMRKVWMTSVYQGAFQTLPNDTFSFSESGCISDPSLLSPYGFVVLGQSAPLSGTSAAAGVALKQGLEAAFEEQNQAGGISGHRLKLWTLDDFGNVTTAARNTERLLQEVTALAGFYGSGSTEVASDLSTAAGKALIGSVSEDFAINTTNHLVINLRASLKDEIHALIHYGASVRGVTRFSLFYQSDTLGQWAMSVVLESLSRIQLTLLSNASISSRGEVTSALIRLARNAQPHQPGAVIVWAATDVAAQFISQAQAIWQGTPAEVMLYLCPSSVGDGLYDLLDSDASQVYVNQVVQPLSSISHPLVSHYLSALPLVSGSPSSLSLEGYLTGRLVIAALQKMSVQQLRSSDGFVSTLYSASTYVLDTVSLGPFLWGQCNQGLRQVWMVHGDSTGEPTEAVDGVFRFSGQCASQPQTSLQRPVRFGVAYLSDSPTAALQKVGVQAAFAQINSNGGIAGHTLH